jgi:thioredoxin-related protein
MIKKVSFFALIFLGFAGIFSFKPAPKAKINWVSISDIDSLYQLAPKPILIDVYTDWCGWCKEMERITYHNKKLVTYVNDHFYAVKLDAESDATMRFNMKQYEATRGQRLHPLAAYLLRNVPEFPSTVFLRSPNDPPAPLPGYLTAKEMEAPLKYFAEADPAKQSFIDFNQGFKGSW